MKILTVAAAAATFLLGGVSAQAQDASLRNGYVLCESGGQLTWYLSGVDGVSDLFQGAESTFSEADSVAITTENQKARKGLNRGWCASTNDMGAFTVEVLEDCNDQLPYPNGGCRLVRVRPVTPEGEEPNWTRWYTFGNAIQR